MKPGRTDVVRAFLRTFSIQGSWNYRTLIGGGVGYALSPLLRRVHAGDPVALGAALDRHTGEFNSHPYLSPIAIGALARLEHEGEDSETIGRFKAALRAPLGALGDQAIWAGWRPLCTLMTAIAILLGAPVLPALIAYLVVYNALHVGLRIWGFRIGWEAGKGVGGALTRLPFKRFAKPVVLVNQALVGTLTVLLIGGTPMNLTDPLGVAAAVAIALGGYLVPGRVSGPAIACLFASCVVWFL